MDSADWVLDFHNSPFEYKNRIVLDTPFSTKSTISYGLIVYAKDTKKWALIQRKHSVEFLLLMRGLYRLTYLPLLLSSITSKESSIIQDCINNGKDTFVYYFNDELELNPKELPYALTRFSESYNIISSLLRKINISDNKLKWTWPKGRLLITNQKETPFTCAKREFTEEVEIILPPPLFVSDTYVTETIRTVTGRIIESRYWIYVIPNEIPIFPPNNHPEVSNRMWVDTETCYELIEHNALFDKVSNIVSKFCQ